MNPTQRRRQDALGTKLADDGLHRFARCLKIGHDRRLKSLRHRVEQLHHWSTGAPTKRSLVALASQ